MIRFFTGEHSKPQGLAVCTRGSGTYRSQPGQLDQMLLLYGLNLHPDNGFRNSHTYSPLDCLDRGQLDYACYHLHRLEEFGIKQSNVEWKAQVDMYVTVLGIHF